MDIVEEMRGFEIDHEPDGWPGVRMRQVSALCNEIDRLRLLGDEPMRVIAVEAIREVTGCPDIGGNGKYLVDVLMEKVRDFVTPNDEESRSGDSFYEEEGGIGHDLAI